MAKIAKVVVSISLDKEFDYLCPPGLEIRPGMRVLVDFNRKKRVGIVVAIVSKSDISKLKPIIDTLDSQASLDAQGLSFAKQLSDIYPYSRGEFLFMMIPPYLRKPRKLNLKINSKPVAAKSISESKFFKADSFQGRYELWKDRIRERLKKGSVLICFPQLTYLKSAKEIISADFPGRVKVIHSQKREKELFSLWQATRENSLILGTRVAIFYYPSDLELIIVEEENSPYYFQEEKPFHNLLDLARSLSALKGLELILSSDYPSLATYKGINDGKIKLIDQGAPSPKIKVVNQSEFNRKKVIGPVLIELLRKAIADDKRAVILWNRKGFARAISCSNCQYIFKCEHCSSFLQSSLKSQEGVCPSCQKSYSLPKICTQCNNGYLKSKGYGIQRIESRLKKVFPEARIDDFSAAGPSTQIALSTSKILSHFYEPLEFDRGFVLDADLFLNHIEYDTTFNAFLYLKKLLLLFRGSLWVFTAHKDYYLFKHLNENWRDFYESELRFREKSQLPPFGLVVKITLRAKNKKALSKRIKDLYNRLEKKHWEVYGPFEEKPFKLRDKFRYSLIVKTEPTLHSRKMIKEEVKGLRTSSIQMAVSLR